MTIVVLVAALVGCDESAVDVEAERAALRAAADKYHEAGSASDVATVVRLYATDSLILPPNAPAVSGPAAFREFANAFTGLPGFSMRFDTPTVEVSSNGDMGYTLADTDIAYDDPEGARVEDRQRDLHLWKKQNGEWKVVLDIWNSEMPLPNAGRSSPVDGAWVVTSLQSPAGDTIEPAGPSQLIFSDGHYSAVYTIGVANRQESAIAFEPTDQEKVAHYDTLLVNSGTYEVDGNRLRMRPTVAKSPEFIGGSSTWKYSVAGDTISATIIELVAANGETPADASGSMITLRRTHGRLEDPLP